MTTGTTTTNGTSLFAAMALATATFGGSAAWAVEMPVAGFQRGAASELVVKTAVPKAPAAYTKAMIEELKEAQEAQQRMPYLLALHVDGKTSDGITVRINVPVKFDYGADAPATGLFPAGDEAAGQVRLMRAYAELESIFSEELHKMSQHFHSTAFYQPPRSAAHLCDVGGNEVCEALAAPLRAGLQRAQQGRPYMLHIVHEWVNFYGLFNLGLEQASSTASR